MQKYCLHNQFGATGFATGNLPCSATISFIYDRAKQYFVAPKIRQDQTSEYSDGREGILHSKKNDNVYILDNLSSPTATRDARIKNIDFLHSSLNHLFDGVGNIKYITGPKPRFYDLVPGIITNSYIIPVILDWHLAYLLNIQDTLGKACYRWNNKNFYIKFLREHHIPMPKTEIIETSKAKSKLLEKLVNLDYPLVIKEKGCGGGIGSRLVCSPYEAETFIKIDVIDDFQVQEYLPGTYNPCVLYYSGEDGIKRMFSSDQIVSGLKYGGSIYPSRLKDYSLPDKIATLAWEDGYRGTLGIDLFVWQDKVVFGGDINARSNGSTRLQAVHERLLVNISSLKLIHGVPKIDRLLSNTAKYLDDFLVVNRGNDGIIILGCDDYKYGKMTVAIVNDSKGLIEHQLIETIRYYCKA